MSIELRTPGAPEAITEPSEDIATESPNFESLVSPRRSDPIWTAGLLKLIVDGTSSNSTNQNTQICRFHIAARTFLVMMLEYPGNEHKTKILMNLSYFFSNKEVFQF